MDRLEAVNIRNGVTEDIDSIMSIVDRVVAEMAAYGNFQWTSEYPTAERFRQDIQNRSLFVAAKNRAVLGFIVVDQIEPPEYASVAWNRDGPASVIHRFAVQGGARRHGIASSLEAHACELARQSGTRYLRTDTNSSNQAMQGFLKSRNYRYTGDVFFAKCANAFYCYDKALRRAGRQLGKG